MGSIGQILLLVLNIVWWFVIIQVIMSWLIQFQVLNMHQPLVSQLWYGLGRLLEPIYRPIRNILPAMGGIDITPLVVLIGITALQIVIGNNL